MASSPTTRNRLEKQGTGENGNTWGSKLNASAFDLIDASLDGWATYTLSGSKTLSSTNFVADEARMRVQNVSSGTGGTITIPGVEKTYLVRNASPGDVIVTTGGGTTATVKSGNVAWVLCDGAAVYLAQITDYGSSAIKTSFVPLTGSHVTNKTYVDAGDAAVMAYAAALAFSTALPGQTGHTGFVVTNGTSASWSDYLPSSITGLEGVKSVADFKTGLSLAKADVGLSNVNNTADASKPISSATQTALDLKANLAGGNTYTGKQITAASATGGAGLSLPAGAAPTSPVDGDIWTTTAGLFARINGATVGPFGVPSGYAQISSTATTSGTAIDLTSIPAIYSDLYALLLGVSHNNGSSQFFVLALSDNAVNYTGDAIGLTVAASATLYGGIQIPGYLKDAGTITFNVADLSANRTVSVLNGTSNRAVAWRVAGGISALRFTWNGATFDAGTIVLFGK